MPNKIPLRLAIPMVCFCDIPLSQVSDHVSKYGRYAIGIKKDWAIQQGVTPVLYVHENSLIPNNVISELQRLSSNKEDKDYLSKIMRYIDMICMMKRYSGFDKRMQRELCYYDEREWRYIPKRDNDEQFCYLIEDIYNQEQIRKNIDSENEKYGVTFIPDAINYIIVDNDDEILALLNKIRQIKGNYSHNSVELLSTRIITLERIQHDM